MVEGPVDPDPDRQDNQGENQGPLVALAGHLEEQVQHPDQEEEEEDRPRGVEVQGHVGTPDDHVSVGRPDGQKEAQKTAHPEAPQPQLLLSFPGEEGLLAVLQVVMVFPRDVL